MLSHLVAFAVTAMAARKFLGNLVDVGKKESMASLQTKAVSASSHRKFHEQNHLNDAERWRSARYFVEESRSGTNSGQCTVVTQCPDVHTSALGGGGMAGLIACEPATMG